LEAVVSSRQRLSVIAKDIYKHFQERQESQEYIGGKGMIVTMSRRAAVTLYEEFEKIAPDWCNDDPEKGKIKVVMTGSSADPLSWQKHIGNKRTRDLLAKRIKNPSDELQLVIVRDMWLTGFDVPSMHTMYIDKPMQGHNLMQAIARINRVFQSKSGGLIVDYIGIYQNLKKAMSQYSAGDQDKVGVPTEEYVIIMLERYQQICELLHGYPYSFHDFETEPPVNKFRSITRLMDYVLSLGEDKKEQFISWVSDVSRAWSLCSTSAEAKKISVEMGLFKAVRAGIIKYTENGTGKKNTAQLNERLGELVSQAVIANGLIDILNLSNDEHPDISILSDEFLDNLENIEQKNLAVESLNKLIKRAIKDFQKTSKTKSKEFSEMLQDTLGKYRQQSMETGEALKKLISLARELRGEIETGAASELSPFEIGIRDLFFQKENPTVDIELVKEIARSMEEEMSVDWKSRGDVRAKMKIKTKKILRQHGYQQDDFEYLSEQVLQQCELSF
jgi:type I restriction enzyme R subunit